MNKYLMKIKGYFTGYEQFEIKAENKQDAINKATEFCSKSSKYGHGGNYILSSIECVKKLKVK